VRTKEISENRERTGGNWSEATFQDGVRGFVHDCDLEYRMWIGKGPGSIAGGGGSAGGSERGRTYLRRYAICEDSAPYFHNGSKAKFDDVVNFYIKMSQLARQGKLRNGAAEFAGMSISADDLNALVAFLVSLTEDYDDA
jgi:hypothetical protein